MEAQSSKSASKDQRSGPKREEHTLGEWFDIVDAHFSKMKASDKVTVLRMIMSKHNLVGTVDNVFKQGPPPTAVAKEVVISGRPSYSNAVTTGLQAMSLGGKRKAAGAEPSSKKPKKTVSTRSPEIQALKRQESEILEKIRREKEALQIPKGGKLPTSHALVAEYAGILAKLRDEKAKRPARPVQAGTSSKPKASGTSGKKQSPAAAGKPGAGGPATSSMEVDTAAAAAAEQHRTYVAQSIEKVRQSSGVGRDWCRETSSKLGGYTLRTAGISDYVLWNPSDYRVYLRDPEGKLYGEVEYAGLSNAEALSKGFPLGWKNWQFDLESKSWRIPYNRLGQ